MRTSFFCLLLPLVYSFPLDTTNKTEILGLAELAANAYRSPEEKDIWRNTTGIYEYMTSFGYEKDGLRNHLFSHTEKDVLVIAIKGTSLSSHTDKENDNIMFGCCCGFTCKNSTCDNETLKDALPTLYVQLVLETYRVVTRRFPNKEIVFTGHSLGASIASIAGMETCRQTVAFSSPPEALFAQRINLQHNCGGKHPRNIFHFGYTNDPIFKGTCGFLCTIAGYSMDSKCHHGLECEYKETPSAAGSTLITRHTINYLIDDVITKQPVPQCVPVTACNETCSYSLDKKNAFFLDKTL